MMAWGMTHRTALIGVTLIGIALLLDVFGIGSVGIGIPEMLLIGIGLVLIAVHTLGISGMVRLYRDFALILLNTLLFFVCIEFGARVLYTVGNVSRPAITAENRDKSLADQPYYLATDWGQQYWKEDSISLYNRIYAPFTVWQSGKTVGETLNIGADGYRIVPEARCEAEDAYVVWVFGGSTVYGTGSPDWGTLPAFLQQQLSQRTTRPVCVRNFGERAYVVAQDYIRLTRLLHHQTPDVAIFYNGINDVGSAYESGRADVHRNLSEIRAKFESEPSAPSLLPWLETLFTYKLLDQWVIQPHRPVTVENYETLAVDGESLSQAVVTTYLGYYRQVSLLAESYGFEFAFFWQPMIVVSEKTLLPEEQFWADLMPPAQHAFTRSVYSAIEQLEPSYAHLFYIAQAVDEIEGQVWVDRTHITPEGNARVAEIIISKMAWDGLIPQK